MIGRQKAAAVAALIMFGAAGCAPPAEPLPPPVVERNTPVADNRPDSPATAAPAGTPTITPPPATATTMSSSATTATESPPPVSLTSPTPDPLTPGGEPVEFARSAGDRPIVAHRLGAGDVPVVVVGGLHGGYEWNSILLAEELLDYFRQPDRIPAALTLHVIPDANPDGLFAVSGTDGPFTPADVAATDPVDNLPGRFNANGVDLNRNWDCNWVEAALWRDQPVSGGPSPFSEPETRGLRDYLLALDPAVVIFLHSAAGAVYVSGCPDPHPPSRDLALIYGEAAGYPVEEFFDHYAITGDAGDWLTTQGIPSFSVELTTHDALDWEQNLSGITALLEQLAETPTAPAAQE
jgi:hypothetical protein